MNASFLDVLQFFAAPFVMCLVLAGIHCYLGLHVLARGVIFVDLSLAQVAAFGATLGLLFGFEHHAAATYFISLGCTFVAAALFALARRHEKLFSQEAIIGITFALASAAVILVVDRAAHGAEHIKEIMVGQVLWVTWHDVIKTSLIYSVVGTIHYVFRKQLINASFNAGNAGNSDNAGSSDNSGGQAVPSTGAWDFLFYALFGVVITSSVSLAGVLQVFAYLIVPAVVSSLFYTTIRARLIFGWSLGLVLSFLSMYLSYRWDLPAGAFIVVCFTAIPVLLLVISGIFGLRRS